MTLIAAIVTGCSNSKNAVAYSVAQNYFVNNTFENKEVETLKIDSIPLKLLKYYWSIKLIKKCSLLITINAKKEKSLLYYIF